MSMLALVCLMAAGGANAMYTSWPFNGRVINQSAVAVSAWDGEHDFYRIAAGSTTSNTFDVDHIQTEARAGWCKIGPNTVTVAPDASIHGCECWVKAASEACAPQDQRSLLAQVASVVLGPQRVRVVLAYLSPGRPVAEA
ncbi:hypothetical protein BJP62_01135 [Jeongeupia sp. USM3]|nr:hypothetical protein BJP62_01135 [Jeongeupia sp. USM3]